MANTKISALPALTGANLAVDDVFPVVDTSAAATDKITVAELKLGIMPAPGPIGSTTPSSGAFTTLTTTGNSALGNAEATDTHAIKGATTVLANSASAALTVTQTGAGNAFVVEDSASTDTTPFVIDGSGNVGIGCTPSVFGANFAMASSTASSPVSVFRNSTNDAASVSAYYDKDRAGAVVQSGDFLNRTFFRGYDGAGFITAAQISAAVDGTPGTNDMPGRLVFSTTADGASSPTERMRIDSAGSVGIGGAAGTNEAVRATKNISSATLGYGFRSLSTNAAGATSGYVSFSSEPYTDSSAFTVSNITHFVCAQGIFGATTVTNQFGFNVNSSHIGATNNYGFYSNIAAAANRYNFYAAGSAPNYFAGVISGGDGATFVGNVIAYNGTAVPAGGIAGVGYRFSTTSNFGVFFGSGAPTLSAAKGSLYLRSDGSGTSDRMYVNTNGTTGWAAVTTAS